MKVKSMYINHCDGNEQRSEPDKYHGETTIKRNFKWNKRGKRKNLAEASRVGTKKLLKHTPRAELVRQQDALSVYPGVPLGFFGNWTKEYHSKLSLTLWPFSPTST